MLLSRSLLLRKLSKETLQQDKERSQDDKGSRDEEVLDRRKSQKDSKEEAQDTPWAWRAVCANWDRRMESCWTEAPGGIKGADMPEYIENTLAKPTYLFIYLRNLHPNYYYVF